MKTVLLVTRVFPPTAAVGVYRVVKFCKFLPEYGWRPVVLTTTNQRELTQDQSLLHELNPELPVYRAANPRFIERWERIRDRRPRADKGDPKEMKDGADGARADRPSKPNWRERLLWALATPDKDVFWILPAVAAGLRVARKERINAIVTTSPPPTTHLVGACLASLTGIPHVVDFRDLWTQGPRYHLYPRPAIARSWDRWLERRILARAKGVSAATSTFVEQLLSNNPDLRRERVVTILNGLDLDDFCQLAFPACKNPQFTILHLGSLYGLRDPSFFFAALDRFLSLRPEMRSELVVRFIGDAGHHASRLHGTVLQEIVQFQKHRPHREVLTELWSADLLLLILGFTVTEAGTIPAKLFEYIATGRPILALTPGGEAKAMIEKYGCGTVLTEPDQEAVCAALASGVASWRARVGPPDSTLRIPAEFDRRLQAGQLAGLLDGCP